MRRPGLQHRPLDGASEWQRHAQALGAANDLNLSHPRGGQAAHRSGSVQKLLLSYFNRLKNKQYFYG
jgi:hypothetical protein